MKKKTIALILSCVLVLGCAIGGTIAWLTDKTDSVVNTFTVGNVDISLAETTTDYKMVPDIDIAKDPKVTVKAGSEACWLFVEVKESTDFDKFVTYAMDEGWTKLTGVTGVDDVYYRTVDATTAGTTFDVLAGNTVHVKETVTKGMMDDIKNKKVAAPTLTFTAYAVQKDGINTAAEAWAKLSETPTNVGE